jgi:hypothetical protein
VQRTRQFRPVGIAAALDLGESREERGLALGGEAVDRLPLRLQPEAARALPRRGDLP